MVTKLDGETGIADISSVLAKIHMVTKLRQYITQYGLSSVLAKIHMVTKHHASSS